MLEDEPDTSKINEGTLNFIIKQPETNILHSTSQIYISEESLTTGWVKLDQCYRHLDKVPKTDIIYYYKFIKNLSIISTKNINKAQLHQQSITLFDVNEAAEICVQADVKIVNRIKNNEFSITNGPYHRQFLDGFYPYHVTIQFNYPKTGLEIISVTPGRQPGFEIKENSHSLRIETTFEGILKTEITFRKNKKNRQQ